MGVLNQQNNMYVTKQEQLGRMAGCQKLNWMQLKYK